MYDRSNANKKERKMNLSTWRQSQSMSQAELGAALNPPVSQGLISQWESGRTRITLDYANQIHMLSAQAVTQNDCADLYKAHEVAPM